MATIFKSTFCTTTLLGMINQLQGVSDLAYTPHINTTLNWKHSVFPEHNGGEPLQIPSLKYFGIGIRGYFNSDADYETQPYYPLATDMDMYVPIPFRVRLLSEDLVPNPGDKADRDLYRMRTVQNINGNDYALYWLKLIEYPVPNEISVSEVLPDGSVSAYDLNDSSSLILPGAHPNLFPEPSKFTTPDVDPSNATTINISMEGTCIAWGEEVLEAINILYGGNTLKAKISEIGLYTGVEDDIPPRATTDYKEAMYVQLAGHRCTTGDDMSQPDKRFESKLSFKDGNIVASVPVV